jgi:hypothetical protein
MYLLLSTFQYFSHSLMKWSDFWVIGCTNWKTTNVLWVLEIKKQHRKHMKRMNIIFFKLLEKITPPFFSFSPISSSYLVCFEGFKTWWVHQLGLYKTFLYVRDKDAMIKDFKLKIPISFLFTHHCILNCLRWNTPYLPQSFIKLNNFWGIGSAKENATNVLWTLEGMMCEDLMLNSF